MAFGGTNPIFIPFTTDESHYDDVYVNQNQNMQQVKVKANVNKDVDFMANLYHQHKGDGYGTYQKKFESDALQGVVEGVETDKQLRRKRQV